MPDVNGCVKFARRFSRTSYACVRAIARTAERVEHMKLCGVVLRSCAIGLLALLGPLGCCCNIANQCIEKGDTVLATYTEAAGTQHSEEVLIGDQGEEFGRCGSGPTSKGWTVDCLNHDMCQEYMKDNGIFENPGGLGPNCWDEFTETIDDYFQDEECCPG